MIFRDSEFVFEPPAVVARARRILIKPSASSPLPYPVSTSPEMLVAIIDGIRRVSEADIILLEGTPDGSPIQSVYHSLGYEFPRVLTLDVNSCVWVEVDNPLPKPSVMPTFWVPNVVLSSDYLISVVPLKVVDGLGYLSLMNLLSLLPVEKYGNGLVDLYQLGIEQVVADLYFTLPFDLGIIEARQRFVGDNSVNGKAEECGKIFVGEPFHADCEVSETLGIKIPYLDWIAASKIGFES